ncbi:MAG: glycosyltransferase family 2 protein [Verrucomicrobiota bacterium]
MDRLENHVAVIPCLNEAQTIAPLIHSVCRHIPNVVVVDDGSRDNTAKLAAKAGARVVSHPRNLGKGAAVKTGLTTAMRKGFDRALLMDGDGQHQAGDIPAFVQKAEATRAALVIGNRMQDAMSIPWLRRQANRWMSWQISRRVGENLPDTQCGFRLVDLKIWAALPCHTRHFEMESEMLIAFLDAGCRVDFVPIKVIGRAAHSHINPLTDTWRWCKWWRSLPAGERIPDSSSSRGCLENNIFKWHELRLRPIQSSE